MKNILILLFIILFFDTTFSKKDNNSLKAKSEKYTGISGKSGDINFGDSIEKCKLLFIAEGNSIDSIKTTETNDTIVFVNKVIIYNVELNNCKFEFDSNGLHTLVYNLNKDNVAETKEIQLIYNKIFYSLKENYKVFENYEELTHSYGEDACVSSYAKVLSFGNKIREIELRSVPENSNDNNLLKINFRQHYNFPKK